MKSVLKRIVLGFLMAISFPLAALVRLGDLLGLDLYHPNACMLSLIPGKLGSYLRLSFYKFTLSKISADVSIGFGSFFSNRLAEVGKNVSIGAYSIIGNAKLGDNVLIASRVSITSGKHQHSEELSTGNSVEPKYEEVIIGDRTWIGEGAIVMANVGSNCIVAAGSVVSRSIPDNYLVSGNPGRPLRNPAKDGV